MKKDEQIALDFLKSLNIGMVEHEPDGNVTPDFVIDKRVAVEVRRLNMNYILSDGQKEGFENIVASAWLRIDRILKTMGPSIAGESWNVVMQFSRPLDWKSLAPEINTQLNEFKFSDPRHDVTLKFGENFELDLMRSRRKLDHFFNLMGSANLDAGGAVMALVEKNLRLCVTEKEKTVTQHRHKYQKWWLVLINRVDLNMIAEDYQQFGRQFSPPIEHNFEKIILVDPRDVGNWFELNKHSSNE